MKVLKHPDLKKKQVSIALSNTELQLLDQVQEELKTQSRSATISMLIAIYLACRPVRGGQNG